MTTTMTTTHKWTEYDSVHTHHGMQHVTLPAMLRAVNTAVREMSFDALFGAVVRRNSVDLQLQPLLPHDTVEYKLAISLI